MTIQKRETYLSNVRILHACKLPMERCQGTAEQISTMDIEGTWLEVVCIKKNKSILYFALALLSAVLLGLVGFITYDVIFKQGHKWLEYFLCVSLVLSFFPIFIYLFRSVYIAVFNDKLVCSRNPKKLLTSADTFARDPEKQK